MKEVISAILLLFTAATAMADAPTKTVYPLVTDTEELQDDTPYYIISEPVKTGEAEEKPLWFHYSSKSVYFNFAPTPIYFNESSEGYYSLMIYTYPTGTHFYLNYTSITNDNHSTIKEDLAKYGEYEQFFIMYLDEDGSAVIKVSRYPVFRLSLNCYNLENCIYKPVFIKDNVEPRPKIYISTAPEGVTKLANAPVLKWQDNSLIVESPDGLPLVYRFVDYVEPHSVAESFDGEWNDWSWENSRDQFNEISKGMENKLLQMKCVDKERNLESEISTVEVSPDHPLTGLIDPVVECNREVYNLQGIKVSQSSLVPGSVYIRVSAGCSEKFVHM